MEEYVLDDGRIKLGPNCVGAVEFEDGHFEPVTSIDFITKAHIRFLTPSGLYSYKEGMESDEILYCDQNPYTTFRFRHEFAKYDYDQSEWFCIDAITKLYVYGPAFPDVFKQEKV